VNVYLTALISEATDVITEPFSIKVKSIDSEEFNLLFSTYIKVATTHEFRFGSRKSNIFLFVPVNGCHWLQKKSFSN